jgi:hypothetical protein
VDKQLITHKPIRSAFSADPEQQRANRRADDAKAIDPSPPVTGGADQIGDVGRLNRFVGSLVLQFAFCSLAGASR